MAIAGPDRDIEDGLARVKPRELTLRSEQSLPWLGSDEEEDEPEVDTVRIFAFVLLFLAILGLIAGALWWFLGEGRQTLAADGQTIEAPDEPYKTRPEDPGGRIFEGTGDLSFAVGEGESRQARLAEADSPPPVLEQEAEDGTEVELPGVGVQVGAFASREQAQRGWSDLVRRIPVLEGVDHRIVEGPADIGTVHRLQAVTPDLPSAQLLCGQIKASGGACQVKR